MFTGPSYASKQYGALLEELDKEIGIETQNLSSPGTATIKAKSAERVRRRNAPQTSPGQTTGITQDQYNALPFGATCTAPDGTQRVKQ